MSSQESVPTQPPAVPARVSDEALVARARQGDFAAFEALVERYDDKVYRLAFRFVRNESEAREIVQETLLSVWRKLDGFKGDSQFSSWLYRVTANAALMRLRSQRRHPEVSTEDLEPGVPGHAVVRVLRAGRVRWRQLGATSRRGAAVRGNSQQL